MTNLGKTLTAASSLAVLLALGACGDRVDNNVGVTPQNAPVVTTEVPQQRPAETITTTMGAAADTVGAIADDAQIVVKVNTALAADGDLSALKIDVDSKEGVVTLRGTAPDPAAKERAAELARHVKDVKSVDNQLTLG
jgi:hypothetical protein